MFHILMEHPPEEEELAVVRETTGIIDPHFNRPVSAEDLIAFQRLVRRVPVAVGAACALSLVRTSRPKDAKRAGPSKVGGLPAHVQRYDSCWRQRLAALRERSSRELRRHPCDSARCFATACSSLPQVEGVSTDSIIDRLLDRIMTPASRM